MISISLCMIVRDEEDVLARCLDSVRDVVDEIIIVDTGSRDRTKEIARQYTQNLYDFAWVDDFSAARNYAFSKATMDYIMWMDADDVLEDKEAFRGMVADLSPEADTVMMRYQTAFDDAQRPTYWFFRERILRNDPRARWKGAVHEAIEPFGNIVRSDVAISHRKPPEPYSRRNLEIYQSQIHKGKTLMGRDLFYYARELYYHGEYDGAITELNRFLDGPGWVENHIEACLVMASCYEAQQKDPQALRALAASFAYDVPRAGTCCRMGAIFARQEAWSKAIYWYEAALACPRDDASGAFINADFYGYIPCIQLAYCYGKLGQPLKGRHYNNLAGQYKPEHPSYLHNKAYYDGVLGQEPGQ